MTASGRRPAWRSGCPAAPVLVELDTAGTLDLAAERARLAKDLAAAEKELAGNEAKLANQKFTDRAPADVVAGVRTRRDAAAAEITRIRARLGALEG